MPSQPSDLARVLLQVVVVLGVSRAMGLVARRLGQPAAVAEIVAGILLGPSLLGWIAPGAFDWLFPPGSLSGLRLLSQLGLVLFMFLVGLEVDPRALRGRAHAPFFVGAASIAAPLAAGMAIAPWLHARYGGGAPLATFALFVGAAMSVTAFPVLARILSERHLLASRVGAIAIACAAVDDIAAWCLVSFVLATTRSGGWLDALRVTAITLGLVVTMLGFGRPLLARWLRSFERVGEPIGSRALFPILFLLLVVAAACEAVGAHALFGAFLLGAALPKERAIGEALVDRLETVSVTLLLPLFFAYSGLRTQLALVDHPMDWTAAAVVVVAATAGKLGATALVGRLTRMSWREAGAVGILLNTRGLMGLIVLNLGLDAGVLSPTMFTILVLMALVSTLLTSPLLRLVYPDRVVIEERLAHADGARAIAPESTDVGEPDVVIVCISDPRAGPALAALARALTEGRREETRVVGLHLREPSARPTAELRAVPPAEPVALVPFLESARALGLDPSSIAFVSTDPAADIVRIAAARRASTILIGGHEPSWLSGHLDGVVGNVLRDARGVVGVLVGAAELAGDAHGLERVLVASVGEEEDAAPLRLARRLTTGPGGRATFLDARGGRATTARRGATEDAAEDDLARRETAETDAAAEEIVTRCASDRADLVVLGLADARSLSVRDRFASSDVSFFDRVGVPVLVVRGADGPLESEAPRAIWSEAVPS